MNEPAKKLAVRMLTHNGETHSVSDWARILDMTPNALSKRVLRNIRNGIPPEQALEPERKLDLLHHRTVDDGMSELRAWRLAKGWLTADEAGEYLGLTGSAMRMLERGDAPITDMTRRLIEYVDRLGPLRNADLPKTVHAWRIKHGWGPVEAAERLGIDYTTLWKHEHHERRNGQLRRLMAYVDMDMRKER